MERDMELDTPQITYERTFKFQASHYGPWHHEIMMQACREGSISFVQLMKLMSKLHGHNFVAHVKFAYYTDELTDTEYGVWDEKIEEVVMQWNNCNISTHFDFWDPEKWTSSSENTAKVLARKLLESFPAYVREVEVKLYETEDISCTARAYRNP
jgi:6-pyruvoyl-tetrahydropterin synthase